MRILLDTNVLLWLLYNREDKLTSDVKKIIYDTSNDLFVSVCSLWETEIKHLKKPELMPISGDELYEALTDTDVRLLDIDFFDIAELKKVNEEKINSDPFDQLIVATAIKEKLTVLTSDKLIAKYKSIDIIQC